jgi:hypothetical protein
MTTRTTRINGNELKRVHLANNLYALEALIRDGKVAADDELVAEAMDHYRHGSTLKMAAVIGRIEGGQ